MCSFRGRTGTRTSPQLAEGFLAISIGSTDQLASAIGGEDNPLSCEKMGCASNTYWEGSKNNLIPIILIRS